MATIRVEREHGNFFMAHKGWAQDESLSWQARGVLAYLFTHTDDWQLRKQDLVQHGPCKEYKIKSILQELEEAGYLERERVHNDDGTFEWVSTVFECPPSPNESMMDEASPSPTQSMMDEPGDIHSNNNNKHNNKTVEADAPTPSKEEEEDSQDETPVGSDLPGGPYDPDDWRHQGAEYLIEGIRERSRLATGFQRKGEERMKQEAADELRLLNEQDGFSRKEIARTLQWVVEVDDWWIPNGNLQSPLSLRRKNDDGTIKFDRLFTRAKEQNGGGSGNNPVPGNEYSEKEVDEFVQGGADRDNFLKRRNGDYKWDKTHLYKPS
jgi:hypothetical protein